jgi:hypothetical protein
VFLTAVEGQGPLWIGRGQCLDHYGAGPRHAGPGRGRAGADAAGH